MVLNKFIYAFTIAFIASVATIFALSRFIPRTSVSPRGAAMPYISEDELSRHASPADCWMIIGDNIYDLTPYIPSHPTAPEVIMRWCGRDATAAFDTKEGRGAHTPCARSQLEKFQVGVRVGTRD